VEVNFVLNGTDVVVAQDGAPGSLLDALRSLGGVVSVKDGCSPQGQCGCCTVWVDGQPRLACVTPLRRVAGRAITTVEGLDPAVARAWASAMVTEGGSQCGFCTPGIIMRLEAGHGSLETAEPAEEPALRRALSAHMCRCTGWNGILRAAAERFGADGGRAEGVLPELEAATRRATLEGGASQRVAPGVALGGGGFSADVAPPDCLVAVVDAGGEWVLGETLAEARLRAGRSPGRRRGGPGAAPIGVPDGDWAAVLRTSWVEPAYLEPDASWCLPGGEPSAVLANGGAFGAKSDSPVPGAARRLADETGRPVLALYSREDCVRLGPKRPPLAGGLRADGSGRIRVAACDGVEEAIRSAAPAAVVEPVEIHGPPVSASLRGAGWVEALCLVLAAGAESPLGGRDGDVVEVRHPGGGRARVVLARDAVEVEVSAGDPLAESVLRSYVEGAVHMALGLVTSESLAVTGDGSVEEETIRSFGILSASEMPAVRMRIVEDDGPPVAVADAVFAATAAATWLAAGAPGVWPTRTDPLG
jgi:aerobic-type carbon monoxide dehydrogenase small subunit (CoxS/CutS family)